MANKKLRFVALIAVVLMLVCMLVACTTTATSSVSYKVTIHSDGQSDIVWDRQTGFPTLSKEHHTVAGLYLDAEYKTAVTPEDLVNMFLTSDIDVYVKYDRVHYSITVHPLNGGSDIIWHNEPGNRKPEFKKVGYVMSGFYFDENCTQPADSVFTEDILENKEVWVKWVECDHKALAPADWTIDKPVTCTVDGHKIATCPTCDKTLEETIEALGHNYADDWTIDKDATCTVDGSKSHHCTNEGCDSVSDVTVIPASHTFGEWIAEVPATCTTLGTKGHKDCSVCKKSFTASNVEIEDLTIAINPNNHDIEHHTAKAPTCTEIGWDAYDTCKRAGCEYTTYNQLDAIGHKYGKVVYAWADDHDTCTAKHVCQNGTCGHEETATATVTPVKTQNATCQQVELTKYTATFTADWAETQIVENVQTAEKLAHSYTEPKKDAGYHWNECSCGAVEPNSKVAHSGGTATCINKAVCSCGQEYGELKAHAFGTLIVEVPATCKGTGTKAHYQCSACEQYFDTDRNVVTEADLVISATGHKWSEVTYTWATKAREDGVESLTCTASRYCLYDAQEKEELIAWLNVANPTITASKVQDVSCTQDEKYTYTTRFNAIGTTFATEQTITLVTKEKLGHDLTIKKVHTVVDGVVTNSGHWYECQREGCEYATEKVAHTWDNGVQTKPPTDEVEGEKTYKCTVCLQEKIEYTGKLDHHHTFDADTWKYDDSHHWHPATCKHTEEKDGYAEHTYGIVSYIWSDDHTSCEARRSCACGYVQTEKATITTSVTPATCTTKEYTTYTASFKNTAFAEQSEANIETGNELGHEYGTWIAEVPATCMQTGTLGHYHCSRTGCGKDFDADHQELASLTIAIDENAHQYTAWVSNNNGTHTKTCQNNTAHTVTENCSGGSATCTEQATCSACNGKYNNVLGHNIVLDTTKGTNGYTWSDDHTVCTAHGKCDRTDCTHTVDATATVTSLKTQNATCQQVELTKYTATFTESWAEAQIAENIQTADKADHNYSDAWTIDKTANCTEDGSKSHHCLTEGCDSKSDETPITALGHNIVLDTTKGTNGYTWSDDHTVCTAYGKCDRTDCTHTVDATATVTSDKTQNATCQQVELTKYTATFTESWAEAQIVENVQTADKADHKYTTYTSNNNATCTEDGTKTATCDHGCGTTDTITEEGSALGHDYSWSSNGNGTHTGTCTHNAEHTVTKNCSGGSATCIEQAECSVCHEKYGELGGHTYGEWIAEVPAIDTTPGTKAHYHCNGCGTDFDAEKNEVSAENLAIAVTTDASVSIINIGAYAEANNWANSTIYDSIENTVFKVTVSGTPTGDYGLNTGKYYTSGTNWRIYQNESPIVTVTVKDGYVISSVTITYVIDKTGILTYNSTQIQSGKRVQANGNYVFSVGNTGTAKNGQVRITEIKVGYDYASDEAKAQAKANEIANGLTLDDIKLANVGDEYTTLPTIGADGATITWSVPNDNGYVTCVNNVLTVTNKPTTTPANITLTATVSVTINGVTKTATKAFDNIITVYADTVTHGVTITENRLADITITAGDQTITNNAQIADGTAITITVTAKTSNNGIYTFVVKNGTDPLDGTNNTYSVTVNADVAISVEATPVLDTPEQIVGAAYDLEAGGTLGTQTLEGKVTSIDEAYSTQYKNITVTIQIGDLTNKKIKCYRLTGTGAEYIAVDDTIKVTGTLKNYNGTIEFDSGSTFVYTSKSTVTVNMAEDIKATVTIDGESAQSSYEVTKGSEFTISIVLDTGYKATITSDKGDSSTLTASGDCKLTIKGNTAITIETSAIEDSGSTGGEGGTDTPSTGTTVSVDLTEKFGTYAASNWGSYGEKSISVATLGIGDYVASVNLSRANKQTGTITNMPVLATKNATEYVTITATANYKIKSATFSLKQWNSVTHTIKLEYTINGTTWTASPETCTVSGDFSISDTALPAEVVAVRLSVNNTANSNKQLGIAGFSLVVESSSSTEGGESGTTGGEGGTTGGEGGTTGGEGGTDTPSTGTSTEVTMSFADTTQRTSQDSNSQVWQSGDVTLTNNKGSSTSNVVNSSNPVKLYANSTVIISATNNITKIVFTCNSESYANALTTSLGTNNGTPLQNGKVVTLELSTPAQSITFTCSEQIRLNSMVVTVAA